MGDDRAIFAGEPILGAGWNDFFAVSKLFRIVIEGAEKGRTFNGPATLLRRKKKKKGEKKNWSKRPITIMTENTSSTLPRDEKSVSLVILSSPRDKIHVLWNAFQASSLVTLSIL